MTLLRQRWPWLVSGALICLALCARSDYRLQERARADLGRLAQQLLVRTGSEGSLQWLAVYPEINSVTITGPGPVLLGSYRNPNTSASTGHTVQKESAGLQVEVKAALPPPAALLTELPVLLLTLVLLVVLLPARGANDAVAPEAPPPESDLIPLFAGTPRSASLVLELDQSMRIQQISQGIESFGYSESELLGKSVNDLVDRFHPDHPDSILEVSHAGGGRLDSSVSSSAVHNASGTIEKFIVTLSAPGTSETKGLQARYSRLEQLCQAICDHARDAVVIVDSAAVPVYANPSFRAALGQVPMSVESLLPRIEPGHRLAFANALQRAFTGGITKSLEFELEGPCQARLEGSFHALRPPNSSTDGGGLVVGIFRDVAEARRLQAELDRAKERSGHSQKIEALGRLAGGVAHDFNNLLASMLFNLDAARSCLGVDSPAFTYLCEVQLASSKAVALTSQLLLYSRKERALPRLLSGHRAIDEAARLANGMKPEVGLSLRLLAEQDSVLLDHGQLDRVLLNLIVNAKDATSHGSVEILTSNQTIGLGHATLEAGEYLVIGVHDNGSGVPEEIQTQIFEPYFTTKDVGKGTGLGLSTSLAIVEKAGGRLTLTSRPGDTVFEVWLPVSGGEVPLAEPPSAALPSDQRLPSGRTVLLVEDEVAILKILQRLLEGQGFKVTSATTGARAASLLEASSGYDVLITDLLLPGLTGPELAKLFQQANPGGPVLFMSGFPGDTLDEIELCEHSRFLAKPFSREQLMESLEQLMGQRHL